MANFTVYILKDSTGKFYKGVTGNLNRRFHEHCAGQTKSTRYMDDLKIVHTEAFDTFAEARKREVYFKSAAGRRFIKIKLGL